MHTFCKTVFRILNTEKEKKPTTYFQFLMVCGVCLYYYFSLHSSLDINACPAGRMILSGGAAGAVSRTRKCPGWSAVPAAPGSLWERRGHRGGASHGHAPSVALPSAPAVRGARGAAAIGCPAHAPPLRRADWWERRPGGIGRFKGRARPCCPAMEAVTCPEHGERRLGDRYEGGLVGGSA